MEIRGYWLKFKESPSSAYYFVKGWVIYFLIKKYLMRLEKKKRICPDCFKAGQCKICGCSFTQLALSNKKCHVG